MHRPLLAAPLALVLLAGVATALPSALRGTYGTTIVGKPARLNGKWQLRFLGRDEVRIIRNRKVVVVGKAIVTGTRVKFVDRAGSYACTGAVRNGLYRYRISGRRLTFAPVADKCVGRRLVLTTKPFRR